MSESAETLLKFSSESFAGQRIDKVLATFPEVGTRSRAAHLIEKEFVTINGRPCKTSSILKATDSVEVSLPPPQPTGLEKLDLPLDIVFEDDDVIVVNKPAGLVVHPSAGHAQDTLVNALLHHTNDLSMKFGEERPGIVHRLDKDTSGLLVIAKNDNSHEFLVQQFKQRSIHRIYYAAVLGTPSPSKGAIQSYLTRKPNDRKRYGSFRDPTGKILRLEQSTDGFGKWAHTNYEMVKEAHSVSYLKLKLETGRTHQIRVHLSELGHPIWSDELYGSPRRVQTLPISLRQKISDFPRLALHAAELAFAHPRTQKTLSFLQPWPEDERTRLLDIFGEVPGCK